MNFISIQTEQTTSITDLALSAVSALFCAYFFFEHVKMKNRQPLLWSLVFFLLFIASSLGAILHGVIWDENAKFNFWIPIKASLALSISLFALAAYCDLFRRSIRFLSFSTAVLTALTCGAISLLHNPNDIIMKVFQLTALVFSFTVYLYLIFRNRNYSSIYMIAGILITATIYIIAPTL